MRTLVAFAKKYHITVVPAINVLGHCGDLLSYQQYGDLKEYDADAQNPKYSQSFSLCVSSPRVKELLADMIDEICGLFDSEIIHVGGDEVSLIGKCPSCRPLREKYGKNGLYLRHFIYINDLLKSYGRTMGVWGDEVLIMEPESSYWCYRKQECEPDKYDQDLKLLDELRDNTIFYDWYYNGGSIISQKFFARNNLRFIACSSTFSCYVTGQSLGQTRTQHALYSTAEQFDQCEGFITADWINHTGAHAEMQYFSLAGGAVMAWAGCGDIFARNQSLESFQKAYSFQRYKTTDGSLTDYYKYSGDFCSELLELFPPTLRGVALRKVAFFNDNPLLFSVIYGPYLKGKLIDKYEKRVGRLKELFDKIDLSKQDKYFFINRSPLIIHTLLLKRYKAFDEAYVFYDKAARMQYGNQTEFENCLKAAAQRILAHKHDFDEATEYIKKAHALLGLEKGPLLRIRQTLKNIDRMASFILSLSDNRRMLPTFYNIYRLLFSHPNHGYWESGVIDWINEKTPYRSYEVDQDMAAAAPHAFASEIDFKAY